jgi:hypothetical protein
MTMARITRGDAIALVAALALLLVMALDWYGSKLGDEARHIQNITSQPNSSPSGEVQRRINQDAKFIAQGQEKNAWQEDGAIDRVILIVLLASAGLAIAAAFLRAAGRRFNPPWTPSLLAAVFASVGAILVAYRIIQKPGLDDVTTVKFPIVLAIVVLGVLAIAAASSFRAEESGAAYDGTAAMGGVPAEGPKESTG